MLADVVQRTDVRVGQLRDRGRFAIEAIRLDSFWLGPFRVPQLASVVGVAIAVAGLAWLHRRRTAVV